MDLKKLTDKLLSSDSIDGLSNLTGVSEKDVKNVLAQALPSLLDGAKGQAKNKETSEGFATALSEHAKNDTNDLTKFLGNVDLADGAKIIKHLLGSNNDTVVKDVAKQSGVSKAKTSSVLSGLGPLLMSLLGQQTNEDNNKDSGVGNLIGSLLDNVDLGSLFTGLLGSDDSSSTKKKKSSKKKSASDSGSGNMLTKILKGLLK